MPAAVSDYILYDGECPVCASYVALANLREVAPQLAVIDARQRPDLVESYRQGGIDINKGMIVKIGELTLDGAPAFAMINRLSRPNSRLMKISLRLLSGHRASRLLYPALALGRRILLLILRRKSL